MHIGIVEDDPDQLALLNVWLTRADHRVQGFQTVAQTISALSRERIGLLLVDWRLPDATGADLIQWVRSHVGWTLPILVLTASREEHIVLAALAAGADDFVLKQPQPLELLARISALGRRTANLSGSDLTASNLALGSERSPEALAESVQGSGQQSDQQSDQQSGQESRPESRPKSGSELRIGPFAIDPLRQLFRLNGAPVNLTQKEFDLAIYLFQSDGRLLSRDHLLNKIWGFHAEVDTRTVDTHISRLRKKLSLDGRANWKLISVYGVGYRLDDGASSAALNLPPPI